MSKQSIANCLKQLRKTSAYSASEIVDMLKDYDINISAKTLYGYESGLSMPNADVFVALCKLYKCDNPMDIFGGLSLSSEEITLIEKYRSLDPFGQETVTIAVDRESDRTEQITVLKNPSDTIIDFPNPTPPIERLVEYFHSASAGTGVFILGNETSDTIPIPDTPENKNVDFAIKVSGESMEPDYCDGDIVLVSQKAELAHGDVGIFIINSNAYIKEYGKTELISRNPNADNIPISEYDNIVCMGKVIGKI